VIVIEKALRLMNKYVHNLHTKILIVLIYILKETIGVNAIARKLNLHLLVKHGRNGETKFLGRIYNRLRRPLYLLLQTHHGIRRTKTILVTTGREHFERATSFSGLLIFFSIIA